MVKAYAKSYCDVLGHEFTCRTIVITAMSGVAATLLHGETTHMCLGMNRKLRQEDIEEFTDTRLVIIDEISFASVQDIETIHEKLKFLMNRSYKPFGGVNVVFAGDYSQLEPVAKPSNVYDEKECPVFTGQLNCYIELDGMHRFKNDPKWGDILLRFREGNPTTNDIHYINEHCHVDVKTPPESVQIATRVNVNRDAINTAIFEDWCESNRPADGSVQSNACVILMDELQMTDSNNNFVDIRSNAVKRCFFQSCGEDDCKFPKSNRGRVDPMLKLYPNCPMMLTENADVSGGIANGSRVVVKRILLRVGEAPNVLKLDCGTSILALHVGQVESLLLEHENSDIVPSTFTIESKKFAFSCKLEVGDDMFPVKMRGLQFPLISNSATTGHKLQGCTLDNILVNDWYYQQNWAYVVLSRVREMKGLYMRQKLSYKLEKYAMCKKMKNMLARLRAQKLLHDMSEEDYLELIQTYEN